MTYYEDLNIAPTATTEEIKRAFKKKAKECHPDLYPNDKNKEEQFKRLSKAHKILTDKIKREKYDKTGDEDPESEAETIAKQIQCIITATFKATIQQMNSDQQNPIESMEITFNTVKKQTRDSIKEIQIKNRQLEKISARIKHKKQNKTLFHSVIQEEIDQNKKELEILKHKIIVYDKIIEILTDFHYDIEDSLGEW